MNIYLDNAATTKPDKRVVEAMMPFLLDSYGNPSSIHSFGRETRSAIERSRKKVAELLGTSPSQIFFTSGGTEADNCAIVSSIRGKKIRKAYTSPLEHHAVLHTLEHLAHMGEVDLELLEVDQKGNINFEQLYAGLRQNPGAFVSLMHGNNEIGNLNPIDELANRVREFGGVYHCDTVQTVGHFPINLNDWNVDFMVGSAHKFHGPKGVGFLYVARPDLVQPLIQGGAQERNVRGGTENLAGIIGLAAALEISVQEMENHKSHILELKKAMLEKLKANIPGVEFNGLSSDLDSSLYTVLNVSLPPSEINEMLVFNLDINKIAASGGSACSSGSEVGSHVLRAIKADPDRGAVRFSFGKFNTMDEIDQVVAVLAKLYAPKKAEV